MAAATGASLISLRSRPAQLHRSLATSSFYGSKLVSVVSFRSRPCFGRLQVTCAAKTETVNKVVSIVKKQLALSDETKVSGESKFSELGADSLDTVEIVMGLEEEFGISVEEDSAQSIATVQDAADLIEKLVEKNSGKEC